MDADRARSYLDDVTSGSDGPGFGAVAAVVALAAAAFLFARRD